MELTLVIDLQRWLLSWSLRAHPKLWQKSPEIRMRKANAWEGQSGASYKHGKED